MTQEELQAAYDELQAKYDAAVSVDGIIASITALPIQEKQELATKVRTTDQGMRAYTAFMFGAGSQVIDEMDGEPVNVQ